MDQHTPRGLTGRFLDVIERAGNRLPDPVSIFVLLAAAVAIASAIVSGLGLSVVHPVSGDRIEAVNLLNAAGLRRMLTEMVPNFTGFAPLGTVLVVLIGVGVAERTGLIGALLRALVLAVPRRAVTATVVFAGILSNLAADAGYVILTPLAAMLFAALGRHPVAGVAAVFAGIGGGFSANLLLNALDPLLSGITLEAAQLYDKDYAVYPTANYFFMAASVPVLVLVGWLVTEKVVEPRLGPWSGARDESALAPLSPVERRGVWIAAASALAVLAAIAALVIPEGAPLRDPQTGTIAPFYTGIVALMTIAFITPGLAYGLATRAVKSDRDAARMMAETMATMGTYIVLAFFAGQAIAWFRWSNLGLMLAVSAADLLRDIQFTGVPLMLAIVFVTGSINLLLASASAKWVMLAPVLVPMMMALGWSPETTQALYRVGDSITNTITPLNYYLPSIILPAVQRYVPSAGMGTLLAAMVPYAIAFGLAWTVLLIAWVLLGVPLGPDAPLAY